MTGIRKHEAKKIEAAYARATTARVALAQIGRCMEVTEDRAGILWERWLVGDTQIVLMATPHWCEVFKPVTAAVEWEETLLAAIVEALAKERNKPGDSGVATA